MKAEVEKAKAEADAAKQAAEQMKAEVELALQQAEKAKNDVPKPLPLLAKASTANSDKIDDAANPFSNDAPLPSTEDKSESPKEELKPESKKEKEEKSDSDSCGGKSRCGQMSSCSEAKHYLNDCGISSLDRDDDGIPCEKLCK